MSPARTTDRMAGRLRSLAGAAVRRLRLLGWSYALAVLGLAGLGLLVLILAAVPLLVLFPVGASLLLALVRLVRRFADAQRWIIGSTLRDGDHGYGAAAFDPGGLRLLRRADDAAAMVPRGYQPWPSGSRWHQVRQVAGEPATRRDLAWLLVGGPAALVAVLLVGVLPVASVHFGWLPLQYALMGAGQAGVPGLWTVDSQTVSFIGIPVGLLGLLLWWWIAPPVLRGNALVSRRLLGTAATTVLTTRIRTVRIRQLMAAGSPAAKAGSAAASRRARLETLTPREREVLALIAEGRTNAAIAARLYISEKAVDKHINGVFRKLGLTASAEDNRRVLATLAYLRD
jgi:DNA-binding CsgD family transcriptional regulator